MFISRNVYLVGKLMAEKECNGFYINHFPLSYMMHETELRHQIVFRQLCLCIVSNVRFVFNLPNTGSLIGAKASRESTLNLHRKSNPSILYDWMIIHLKDQVDQE